MRFLKILLIIFAVLVVGINAQTTKKKVTPAPKSKKTKSKLPADVSKVKPAMIFIEGGTFSMGSDSSAADEKPVHSVTLNDFYIGKYEVTQKEWIDIMGENPSDFPTLDRPVENVSWDDIQLYLDKLYIKTGMPYRLPTEAEWEYAAKGGQLSKGYKFSGADTIYDAAWIDGNSGKTSHKVGEKRANELGLYDMTGNVWEWCQDIYAEDFYKKSPAQNPHGPKVGTEYILRGGSWINAEFNCRMTERLSSEPTERFSNYGFRVVLDGP